MTSLSAAPLKKSQDDNKKAFGIVYIKSSGGCYKLTEVGILLPYPSSEPRGVVKL
jgi:hypothetical protein